jgi:hypothetical protein
MTVMIAIGVLAVFGNASPAGGQVPVALRRALAPHAFHSRAFAR